MNDHIQQVTQDLACPQCEYNLRGLHGEVVNCPECGEPCNIAKLIERRWTKPWWKAPKFNTVLMPAVTLYVAMLLSIPSNLAGLLLTRNTVGELPVLMIWLLLISTLWLWLMNRAYRLFDSQRGIWLALLAHVLVAGYLMALMIGLSFLMGLVMLIFTPSFSSQLASIAITLLILIVAIAIIYACRRGERYIAGQCIRRYLNRPTDADETAT